MSENQSTCSSLFLRIRNQYVQDLRYTLLTSTLKNKCFHLLIYISILFLFQCPNRLYNAWTGPFTMNLKQFNDHLKTYYDSYTPFHRYLFHREYVQIELGKNNIDQNMKNTLRVFYGHHSHGKLLYTFNEIREPTIYKSDMTVYIRFAANEQADSEQRYPYNFQSFSVTTLRCIIHQLAVPSSEYALWIEKSDYIKYIENIYGQNPRIFNNLVIKQCGILIGYLYEPTNEDVYPSYSYKKHWFNERVRIFDVSSAYTPYFSYILMCLFIYVLFQKFLRPMKGIIDLFYLSPIEIHPVLKQQMNSLGFDSFDNLDNILSTTIDKNNYYDRLFIVDNKYLIMFMIDLDEQNKKILRKYSKISPLVIIYLDNIQQIRQDYLVLKDYFRTERIYFPEYPYDRLFDASDWLHDQLMIINDHYRYMWEEEQQLLHEAEMRRIQEEYRNLLTSIMEEETQLQLHQYQTDINRLWQGSISASPRFIAQFRLADRQTVTFDLLNERCSICLENFQLNQYYTQWPCSAKHTFHFDCMLDVLRTGNKCPLCRHPVESSDLFNRETALRLLFGRMMPHLFP